MNRVLDYSRARSIHSETAAVYAGNLQSELFMAQGRARSGEQIRGNGPFSGSAKITAAGAFGHNRIQILPSFRAENRSASQLEHETMGLKLKLIVLLIKVVFLPFVLISAIARLLGNRPEQRWGITLYRRKGAEFEFVHASDYGDQVLEQRGNGGEMTEREYHPADALEEVKSRVDALIADGFIPSDDFDGYAFAELSAPIAGDFPDKADYALRNELWDVLDGFLADTGLGYVSGASGGSGSMDLDLELVDTDLGRRKILEFVDGTKFAAFTRFTAGGKTLGDAA